MPKFSVERFVRETSKTLTDERWQPLLFSLTTLSGLAASYCAYTGIRTRNMGEDDLFPDFTTTLQQMIKAKQKPEEVFYYLPQTRNRAQLMIGAGQRFGNRKLVGAAHSPLVHAYEWELLGGLSLQQVTLEAPGTEGPEGLTDISTHHAFVGEGNSLRPALYLESPDREADIDRIIIQYPAGERAVAARRSILGF